MNRNHLRPVGRIAVVGGRLTQFELHVFPMLGPKPAFSTIYGACNSHKAYDESSLSSAFIPQPSFFSNVEIEGRVARPFRPQSLAVFKDNGIDSAE